ncbi:hypothetical protein IVB34_12785 [Bradyrhizobium sp. 2]|uniref:hypothetical protein n=1 Tax=Bradyrhizobium sp. 2 TaxID=190045 RepID=UPI001FF83F0D|nr:hypothetical protein [Bradyrhizobium sp. 2]MCK1459164.1 hypothetical protein [Bradyrhizobium sp. 2]MCK1459231.1 hypothetical protein [Bradyrhizobium sp. 2]
MIKRLCLALAGLFVLASVAQGAGTVPGFSLVPQFDLTGKIAPGCRLYVIQAGTVSTPQNAYQDSSLTLIQPNPMLCDAAGRLPQWFVADGSIKLRLTDKNGVQIFNQDGLLVVGASSGGGGGSPVDPTTIIATGDFKQVYGTGIVSGFVRANGRTIGSATSGATERANADTSALFSFLWGADPNLAVSGGRGANAAADFAANKTIALPDLRGRVMANLDDMGNTAAGRIALFGANAIVLGSAGGQQTSTLVAANVPTITSTNASQSITVTSGGANIPSSTGSWAGVQYLNQPGNFSINNSASGVTNISSFSGTNSISTTYANASPTGFSILQPMMLITTYIKL